MQPEQGDLAVPLLGLQDADEQQEDEPEQEIRSAGPAEQQGDVEQGGINNTAGSELEAGSSKGEDEAAVEVRNRCSTLIECPCGWVAVHAQP